MAESTFRINADGANPYRNAQNQLLTRGLFNDAPGHNNPAFARYTLKNTDDGQYRSLRTLYLSETDPTEYQFATKYFENYDHWMVICDLDWFKPFVTAWRAELAIRIKSEALARVMTEAATGGKNALVANKYLVDNNFVPGTNTRKGRPSKADIKAKAEMMFLSRKESDVESDFERILGNA